MKQKKNILKKDERKNRREKPKLSDNNSLPAYIFFSSVKIVLFFSK